MHFCIESLLSSTTEENVERLCKLLTTIGLKLENESDSKAIEGYIKRLEKLIKSSLITTSRIKFDIMNVIDLQKDKWKPRVNARMQSNPKTLRQLAEEDEKEKMETEQQLQEYQDSPMNNQNERQEVQFKPQRSNEKCSLKMPAIDFKKLQLSGHAERTTLGPSSNFFQNFNSKSQANQPDESDKLNKDNDLSELDSSDDEDVILGKHYFTIELSDDEVTVREQLEKSLTAFLNREITMEMLIDDTKTTFISKNVLTLIYSDSFDKSSNERKVFLEVIIELIQKKLLKETVNIRALKILLKIVSYIMVDVPRAAEYFGEYFSEYFKIIK